MRERIRDKERLVHMLTAIDNLIDGSKRYTVEQAEKDSKLAQTAEKRREKERQI